MPAADAAVQPIPQIGAPPGRLAIPTLWDLQGHEAAPAPVVATVMGSVDWPSETVTVAPAIAPDGAARRIDRRLPVIEVVTAPLSTAAE